MLIKMQLHKKFHMCTWKIGSHERQHILITVLITQMIIFKFQLIFALALQSITYKLNTGDKNEIFVCNYQNNVISKCTKQSTLQNKL